MTLLLPGLVAGLFPCLIAHGGWAFTAPVSIGPWLGGGLLAAGVCVLILTIWAFAFVGHGTLAPWDAPTALVDGGLYRWVRNPMYLGVLAVILGQGFLWGSLGVFAYAALVAVGFHLRVVHFEEPSLRRQFGEQFAVYLGAVPRWIPRPPRAGSV